MSGESRSLPSRPSLRYLKLEAKRRLSAGEFRALHEAQLAVQVEIGGVQIFATAAAFAELGLASLVLAGSRPDTPMWTLARGWADLDRAVVLEPATGSRRTASPSASPPPPFCDLSPTAVSVLMTQPTTTGSPYTAAAARLVLEPLQMSDSSFPARWPDTDPDAITGHNVTPEGAFMPEPARICSIPAAGGLWATAADLVRFGLRWSSLLPEALARKALRPQAAGGPGRGQRGLGWLIDHPSGVIGAAGGALGASTSLLIRGPSDCTRARERHARRLPRRSAPPRRCPQPRCCSREATSRSWTRCWDWRRSP